MSQPGNTGALELAGQRAVTEARRLWNLDIYDPPVGDKRPRTPECLSIIAGIIDRCGWLSKPYAGNGPPQWCGLFAGDCWRAAGMDPKWLAVWWASTMRLGAWARYQNWNEHKNPKPSTWGTDDLRMIGRLDPGRPLPFEPRAGDVVVVGDGNPTDGDHITLLAAYNANRRSFNTLSGNGGGIGPKGDSREGISQREYLIDAGKYRAMWLVRPAFGDLLSEAP